MSNLRRILMLLVMAPTALATSAISGMTARVESMSAASGRKKSI